MTLSTHYYNHGARFQAPEDAYSRRESEAWEDAIRDAVRDIERERDEYTLGDDSAWMRAFIDAANEWRGYAEPGYLSAEHAAIAATAADAAIAGVSA